MYVIFPGEGKTIGSTVNEKVKKARRKKKILSLMFQIVSQDRFSTPLKHSLLEALLQRSWFKLIKKLFHSKLCV